MSASFNNGNNNNNGQHSNTAYSNRQAPALAAVPLLVSNGLNGAPIALHKTSRPHSQIGGGVNTWAAQSNYSKN